MKFPLALSTIIQSCVSPLFQNQCLLFSSAPSFSMNISTLRSEHTIDYHPSSSGLTSKILYLIYLCFFLSRIFVDFFLEGEYPTMVGKNFQIYGV